MTCFLIFTFVVCAISVWLFRRLPVPLGRAFLIAFIAPTSYAASIGTIANPVIDQVQGEIVTWIITGIVSAFLGLVSWLGGIVGVRLIERLNRATIQEAAERYANGLIDLAQARYLDANPSAVGDLVARGIDYIKGGNAGTVKQSKMKDDRLGAYVIEAIQKVKADRLSAALGRALSSTNTATSGS